MRCLNWTRNGPEIEKLTDLEWDCNATKMKGQYLDVKWSRTGLKYAQKAKTARFDQNQLCTDLEFQS